MRILYVDALLNRANALGRIEAYEKVSELCTFDYRAKSQELGKGVPWSRPDIMNSALIDLAEEVQPDLVQIGKGETLFGCTVREIKRRTDATIVHFYGDLPVEWRERPVKYWVQDVGQEADLTLLYHWDERIFKAHLGAGCRRVGFWGAGVDLNVYHPSHPVERSFETTFIGNRIAADGAQRLALFHALAKSGITVEVFGGGWGNRIRHENVHLHGRVRAGDFAKVSSRSKIVLSHNPNEVRGYCSWNRPLRSMACGAMVLCRYFPGLEEVFEKEVHLDWFVTLEEAVELAHRYLDDPDLRARVAAEGLQEVRRNHSWDVYVETLLSYVEEIRAGRWVRGTGRLRDGTEVGT